jgi:ATP-dependent Clp protease, protease subunit
MLPNSPPNADVGSSMDGRSFLDRPISKIHKYYLSGPLGDPSEYVQWFENIRNLPETDVVVIHINSEGGNAFAAIQFLRVLRETKAVTVSSVEGLCMSAATMIFMGTRHHEITEHSMFLFHNYSGISIGKGGEMFDMVNHSREWSEKLLRSVYKSFLNEEEIGDILKGKDLYMTGEEVSRRMELRQNESLPMVRTNIKENAEPSVRPKKKTKGRR